MDRLELLVIIRYIHYNIFTSKRIWPLKKTNKAINLFNTSNDFTMDEKIASKTKARAEGKKIMKQYRKDQRKENKTDGRYN